MRRRRVGLNPETALQIACANYLTIWARNKPHIFWCHIPNGGKRTVIEGALFKRMGVKSGVPDLLIFFGTMPVWVELKCGKNKASESQKIFLEWATKYGHAASICYGVDELAVFLNEMDLLYSSHKNL